MACGLCGYRREYAGADGGTEAGVMVAPRGFAIVALLLAAAAQGLFAQGALRAGKTAGGIAYDVQGSGPVVVLLSGSNLDRRMWAYETAWLAKTHMVVRYDLRAHGQSDTATALFSHLDDLIGLLDELKIAKATLIGLSAG